MTKTFDSPWENKIIDNVAIIKHSFYVIKLYIYIYVYIYCPHLVFILPSAPGTKVYFLSFHFYLVFHIFYTILLVLENKVITSINSGFKH